MKLPTVKERDEAMRELLENNQYVNADGTPFVPDNLDVDDPEGDADMGGDDDEDELEVPAADGHD